MKDLIRARLIKGRGQSVLKGHPWVYSGALADAALGGDPGQVVQLHDSQGNFVAWCQYNPGSKLVLRVLERNPEAYPDQQWLSDKLAQAIEQRAMYQGAGTRAVRLIFGDADGLPGLIVDRLGDALVVQLDTQGADSWRAQILDTLVHILSAGDQRLIPPPFRLEYILERSNSDGRQLEGLEPVVQTLWSRDKEPLSSQGEILEGGIRYRYDRAGQKTGFYCDQRDNRALVAQYARGARVLDAFCYTGGFGAACAGAGAISVDLLDASAQALELAQANVRENWPQGWEQKIRAIEGDGFAKLRDLKASGQRYNLVILDPPKLAPTRKSLKNAANGYKDLNLQALSLLDPGGILASFSCSSLVSAQDLRLWISWAAADLGLRVQVLHHLSQSPCHPVPLGFPEAQYLKGFVLKVL